MILFFSIFALFIAPSLGVTGSLSKIRALKFAPNSFIQYRPDWSRLTSVITVCSWIKDIGSSTYRNFFSYHSNPYELTILADGNRIGIFGLYQNLPSKFTVRKGTWHFVCVTWSLKSREHKYYVNGELLGSQQTAAGRSLRGGGYLSIGKWITTSSGYDFAGEMVYLNVYAKELSSSEITSMMELGMCNTEVDAHESSRVIKWDDLLELERTGIVSDEYVAECVDSLLELNAKLADAEKKLNDTLTENEKLSTNLTSTLAELKDATAVNNRTWDWQIFLSEQFLDQTFTAEYSQLFHSTWDDIAGLCIMVEKSFSLILILVLFKI